MLTAFLYSCKQILEVQKSGEVSVLIQVGLDLTTHTQICESFSSLPPYAGSHGR